MRIRIALYFLLFLAGSVGGGAPRAFAIPEDRSAAVIFVYHRIDEDQYPDSNLQLAQFKAQLDEIKSGPYNIARLEDVLKAFASGSPLPDRTIVLTFDGGYRSAYERAIPLLLKENIPFTIFFATDIADSGSPEYIGWGEIKKLMRNHGVSTGIHGASLRRLYAYPKADILLDINKAKARYREETGSEPQLFAYPSGEYSAAYQEAVETAGFAAALTQNSGVSSSQAAPYALPRFSMTESYGGIDRFRLTASARPFPVLNMEPADPLLTTDTPVIGFTLTDTLAASAKDIACFASEQGRLKTELLGSDRIEVRLENPVRDNRIRVNCTLFGGNGESSEEKRWRWLSQLYLFNGSAPANDAAVKESASAP